MFFTHTLEDTDRVGCSEKVATTPLLLQRLNHWLFMDPRCTADVQERKLFQINDLSMLHGRRRDLEEATLRGKP